ncbi:hypothetical protein FRC11_006761 [Ceratobasidium sp. 423]|nr:hypothetical protein FRC11_006761 [Ceratobasidium sp. 423]
MAFDPETGLFAFADQYGFLVFRTNPNRARSKKWLLIDRRNTVSTGGRVCDLTFILSANTQTKRLFIGTTNGAMIWTGKDEPFFQLNLNNMHVARCIVSNNGTMLAASTPDLRVLMWPILASGLDLADQRVFRIPTGRNHCPLIPGAPLAFFGDDHLLTADPLGRIYLINTWGEEQDSLNLTAWYLSTISFTDNWLYVTSINHVNEVHINAYSNNNGNMRRYSQDINNHGSIHAT